MEKTRHRSEVIDIAEFKHLSTRLQFVQFEEHLSPIGTGDQEKIDSRAVRAMAGGRINRSNSEFVFQNLRGAVDIGAAKFHLLDAISRLRQILCDRSRTARLARGENVQGNPPGEMKFELLAS